MSGPRGRTAAAWGSPRPPHGGSSWRSGWGAGKRRGREGCEELVRQVDHPATGPDYKTVVCKTVTYKTVTYKTVPYKRGDGVPHGVPENGEGGSVVSSSFASSTTLFFGVGVWGLEVQEGRYKATWQKAIWHISDSYHQNLAYTRQSGPESGVPDGVPENGERCEELVRQVHHPVFRDWGGGFQVFGFGFDVSGYGFRVLNSGFRVSRFGFQVSGFGFRVPGIGSRVSGLGCRVPGSGFRVPGFGFRVPGFGSRVPCSGFRIPGSGFRFPGFGFRVSGLGFRVSGSGYRC